MKLYAAPLQGFTEAPWRNLHQEVFGGIDAYYTPFVRMEKGEFRNKDVREIASENNTVSRLIPQLIASTPAELERLAGLFIEKDGIVLLIKSSFGRYTVDALYSEIKDLDPRFEHGFNIVVIKNLGFL